MTTTSGRKRIFASIGLMCLTFLTLFYLNNVSPQVYALSRLECCYEFTANETDVCESQCFGNCKNEMAATSLDSGGIDSEEKKAFLLETSGRRHLDARQSCSLESLARQNPELKIFVFMTANSTAAEKNDTFLETLLRNYRNVRVELIDLKVYLTDSPLEKWLYCSDWASGPYRVAHLSDALRVLSVWKYGGYYFDFDFIHIKPVTLFKNFVALENGRQVGNSVFHGERKNELFTQVLEDFSQTYRSDLWAHNGPGCFTRVLQRFCNTPNLSNASYIACRGFNILPSSSFYPLYYPRGNELFKTDPGYNVSEADWMSGVSLGIHVWNKITAGSPVFKNSSQIYVQLAKLHCPVTLALAPDVF